jgi:hypothetical protein
MNNTMTRTVFESSKRARHEARDARGDLAWLGLMTDPGDEGGSGLDYFHRAVGRNDGGERTSPRPRRSRSVSRPTHWATRLALFVGVSTIVSLAVYLG